MLEQAITSIGNAVGAWLYVIAGGICTLLIVMGLLVRYPQSVRPTGGAGLTVVSFEPKRVDETQRDEDPQTAGKWILALSLWDRATSPSYDRLEFTGGSGGTGIVPR
jgi:hypothetical protein